MATRGVAMTIAYVAWDTNANAGKTGDAANHTLRWIKDGAAAAPTNAPTEVDATNTPGLYKIALTATETDCDIGVLCGKSSTSNVSIIPVTIQFERLPNAAPGATGGLPLIGASPLTNLNADVASRATASDVWNHSTRTLTAFSFPVDVNMSQALPASPTSNTTGEALKRIDANVTSRPTAADVWSHSSRTLTAFTFSVDLNMNQALPASPTSNTTGESLKRIDANIASRPTASDVWNHSSRTLTAFAFTVDLNMNQALPASPNNDTTGQALKRLDTNVASRSTAADVWSHSTRTLTAFTFTVDLNMSQQLPANPFGNTVGQSLKWIDTNIASRPTASDVWSHSTRTLTAFGFSVDVNMGQTLPASPTSNTVGKSLKNAADYVDAAASAIKAKTDKLTFNASNQVFAVCDGGGGGGGGGGSVQVVVQPLSVRVFEPTGDGGMITMWRYARARAAWYVNADLRSRELVWLAYAQTDPNVAVSQCTSAASEITVEWQDTYSRSYVSLDAAEAKVPAPGTYRYVLRDQTTDTVLLSGTLVVRAAPDAA